MPVESASYVNQLDPSLPSNTDPISEGDNHLRLIKQALKNTFPNVGGQVTLSDADLNNAAIRSAALTSGALVKADASGKLTSSYAEADVPRRNQAETITGGWTFSQSYLYVNDSGSPNGNLLQVTQDDQNPWAIYIRNSTFNANFAFGVRVTDAGDATLQVHEANGNAVATLTLKQDGSAQFSGRLDAATMYENNLRVLAQMNSGRLIGRTTAGAGQWEEISPGDGLSLSGGVLNAKAKFLTQATGTLASGSVYQNTSGLSQVIAVRTSLASKDYAYVYCDSSSNPATMVAAADTPGTHTLTFVVPPGYYYKVVAPGTINYTRWQ